MTCVLEDMKMKFEGAQRLRSLETIILKSLCNILLAFICNIQMELVQAVNIDLCLFQAD